jgi:hypothetical protein
VHRDLRHRLTSHHLRGRAPQRPDTSRSPITWSWRLVHQRLRNPAYGGRQPAGQHSINGAGAFSGYGHVAREEHRRRRSARMTVRARASRRDQGLRHPHDHAGCPCPHCYLRPHVAAAQPHSSRPCRGPAPTLARYLSKTIARRLLDTFFLSISGALRVLGELRLRYAEYRHRPWVSAVADTEEREPRRSVVARQKPTSCPGLQGGWSCCHRPQCDGGACRLLVLGGNIADC